MYTQNLFILLIGLVMLFMFFKLLGSLSFPKLVRTVEHLSSENYRSRIRAVDELGLLSIEAH